MDALTPAAKKHLSTLLPHEQHLPFVLINRQGTIRYSSPAFNNGTGLIPETLAKRTLKSLLIPCIESTPKSLSDFLVFKPGRTVTVMDAVLRNSGSFEDASYQVSLEEKNGIHVALYLQELDRKYALCIMHSKNWPISRHMGILSNDLLVTLDSRNRIIGMSESIINMLSQSPKTIFGRPIEEVFVPGMLAEALHEQGRIRAEMLEKTAANSRPWEQVYRTDFAGEAWKADWIISDTEQVEAAARGIRIGFDKSATLVFLHRNITLDSGFDYRWTGRAIGADKIGLSFFFNGFGDPQRPSNFAGTENAGYMAGFLQHHRWGSAIMRIKRRGWVLTGESVPEIRRARPFTFSAEKSGGVFRLALDDSASYDYVDTKYRSFCDYRHTGFVISQTPFLLEELSLSRRRSAFAGPQPPHPEFDLRLACRPDEIFEAQFIDRSSSRGRNSSRSKVTDVYLRNVTELRRTQKANRELLEQKSLTLQQLNNELALAADVLNGLLPKSFPEIPGLRFHSYFKPSGHVGGDLFDVFVADPDRVAILMYDVSGHGVPAALISVMTRTLFQKHYHPGTTVLGLLDKVNHDLCRDMPGRGFVTLFFGLLDHRKRELCYAGAGFTTPVAVSGKSLVLLNTKGIPLGIQEKLTSSEYRVSLSGPSKLLLFTDGLYEIFSADDEFYGPRRMTEFVERNSGLSVRALIDAVVGEHNRFGTGTDQRDDVSILGLEIDGA